MTPCMQAVYNINLLSSRREKKIQTIRRRTSPSGETVFEPLTAKHVIVAVGPQPVIKAPVFAKKKREKRRKTRSTTCLGGSSGEKPIGALRRLSRASLFRMNLNFIGAIYPARASLARETIIGVWQSSAEARTDHIVGRLLQLAWLRTLGPFPISASTYYLYRANYASILR